MADDQKKEKKLSPEQQHKLYEPKGEDLARKNLQCPKCGPGIFMARHKDRNSCGKCGYTEFTKN